MVTIMLNINAKDARQSFSALLDRVARGEEVVILRRGEQIAHLIPHEKWKKSKKLPSLEAFRKSLASKGKSMSKLVVAERDKERY